MIMIHRENIYPWLSRLLKDSSLLRCFLPQVRVMKWYQWPPKQLCVFHEYLCCCWPWFLYLYTYWDIYIYTVYRIIYPYVFFGGWREKKHRVCRVQLFFFPASSKRRFLEDFNGFLISEGFMHESKFPKIHIFDGQQTSPHRSGGWNHEWSASWDPLQKLMASMRNPTISDLNFGSEGIRL